MKEMIKNSAILLIITLVAGCLLGAVYENTKDVISKQEEEAKVKAFKEVFADASQFEALQDVNDSLIRSELDFEGYNADTIDEINIAKSSVGDILGYVFTVTSKEGYGGDITFTVGIKVDGTVNGISILSISETAGLGMEAEKILKPQFANKLVDSFVYTKTGATDPNEIDAISGATITTNAFTNGVNCVLYYFNKYLGGAENE